MKALADELGKDPSTVYRWLRGEHPMPAHDSWQVIKILEDLWFLQGYATDCGLLITPLPRPGHARVETLVLIADLSSDLSTLLKIAHDLENKKPVPVEVVKETLDRIRLNVELVGRNLLEQAAKNEETEQ